MIQQGATTIFKLNLLNGVEDFTTDTYKIALYTALADLGPTTTVYTTTMRLRVLAMWLVEMPL
jgi:hypothetical protein